MDVAIDQARKALQTRARTLGFGSRDAARLADHFLDAELRGAGTHGIERMRWLAGFEQLDPTAGARLQARDACLSRYHAAGAVGYVALADTIERELADPPPAARLVVVSACFPTGRLGYFAEMVARAGLACLLCASSPARLSHHDGGRPILGTNPICLALPGDPPALIDVSMGSITYGEVLRTAAAGELLSEGTAIGPDGAPEQNPREVIEGRAGILPFGGDQAHKAFALAAMVELLCGALGGTDGHSAVILMARPHARPAERLRELLDGRRMPGDAGSARRQAALDRGTVTVPDELWSWLQH